MGLRLVRAGGEIAVNQFAATEAQGPAIAALGGGGYVLSWADRSGQLGDTSQTGVNARLFAADGTALGAQFAVNTRTAQFQFEPTIASLANGGGFIIGWNDSSLTLGDASGSSIKAQVFGADGARVGGELLINTTTAGSQTAPSFAGLVNGLVAAVWTDASASADDASGRAVRLQLLNPEGAKAGAEQLVNVTTEGNQSAARVAGLANSSFVVVWTDNSAGGAAIKARLYNAAAAPGTPELLVADVAGAGAREPVVAGLTGGGFVVAWTDQQLADGDASGSAIRARFFSAAGVAEGDAFLVNGETQFNQLSPTVTATADGGATIGWRDNSGLGGDLAGGAIKAQAFDATGARIGSEMLVNTAVAGRQIDPALATLADGRAIAGWYDDSAGPAIKAQALEILNFPKKTWNGTTGIDVFEGDAAFQWTLNGLGGNDTLTGNADDDKLLGGKGNDTLAGAGGNDRFLVGVAEGFDRYDGGAGFDAIEAIAGNMVIGIAALTGIERIGSTAAGVTIGGSDVADVLDFTNVIFDFIDGAARINPGRGNDVVTGSAAGEIFNGGIGNDRLVTGGGDDRIEAGANGGFDSITGGDGFDTVAALANNVVIGLSSLTGVERIDAGSFTGVSIAGTNAADSLDFSGVELLGITSINGGGSADRITGSAGNDTINGQAGADTLAGGGGDDRFKGIATDLSGDAITDFSAGDILTIGNYTLTASLRLGYANGVLAIDRDGPGPQAALLITLGGDFDPARLGAYADPLGGLSIAVI